MTIQFNTIDGNIRVPFMHIEFNPGQSPYQSIRRLLLVGQLLAASSAVAGEPIWVRGEENGLFGTGSMMANMYRNARINAPLQEIWCLPVADDASGNPSVGTITTKDMPVNQNATFPFYVEGVRLTTSALTTDTNDTLAAKIGAAINAETSLSCTANVAADVVTVTSRHRGEAANSIRIEVGLTADDNAVAGTKMTIVQPTGGSGDPDLGVALAGLGSQEFDWIAGPYAQTVALNDARDFLDGTTGRWSPSQQLYGHYITARHDTPATLSTLGDTRNDPHASIMCSYNSPTPSWIWASALGAKACKHLQDAPELSRPLQTLVLQGVRPPKSLGDHLTTADLQVLYYDGISGYHVNKDNTVSINRLITTYQVDQWGSVDQTWLDVNTLAQSMYLSRFIKQKITSKYPRAALMDENPTNIQGVATPQNLRDTIVHGYEELVEDGVTENLEAFKSALQVERNSSGPNRVDVYLPADMVNQLRIVAINATIFQQLEIDTVG